MTEEIRRKIQRQEYYQSILRLILRNEVEEALEIGAVIEDYPSDQYGPGVVSPK